MDDKEFLGYFRELSGQSTVEELKTASANIVSTLLASSTVAATRQRKASDVDEAKAEPDLAKRKAKKQEAFKQKYLTGDLGDGMSADLNYTLKRLNRGLSSESHSDKRGHFLATVEVVRRFKAQIDMGKLIEFVQEETKTSATMKNPEINALSLGQLMCLSALVESEAYQSGAQTSVETIALLATSFISLYKTYDFLRESIQAVFAKLLARLPESHGVKLMEKILAEIILEHKDKKGFSMQNFIFEHSDNLSLYLTVRHAYLSPKYKDQSTKASKYLSGDFLVTDEEITRLKAIVGKSIYIYPRLHTSISLIINEIYVKQTSSKLRLKMIKNLATSLFADYFFKETVYQGIKSSTARPKFLNIGLKFWQMLGEQTIARETKKEVRTAILNLLISDNFLRVFVRGLSIQKGTLFDISKAVKASLIRMLEQVQIPAEQAMQLMQTLFGPNTSTRLAIKRNQDLLKVIALQMDSEKVSEYLVLMQNQLSNPIA